MSTDISIRVPKEYATPAEFAEWEGVSRGSVYWSIRVGKLAKYMDKKEKNKGRVRLNYLKYKTDQIHASSGKSAINLQITIGN